MTLYWLLKHRQSTSGNRPLRRQRGPAPVDRCVVPHAHADPGRCLVGVAVHLRRSRHRAGPLPPPCRVDEPEQYVMAAAGFSSSSCSAPVRASAPKPPPETGRGASGVRGKSAAASQVGGTAPHENAPRRDRDDDDGGGWRLPSLSINPSIISGLLMMGGSGRLVCGRVLLRLDLFLSAGPVRAWNWLGDPRFQRRR